MMYYLWVFPLFIFIACMAFRALPKFKEDTYVNDIGGMPYRVICVKERLTLIAVLSLVGLFITGLITELAYLKSEKTDLKTYQATIHNNVKGLNLEMTCSNDVVHVKGSLLVETSLYKVNLPILDDYGMPQVICDSNRYPAYHIVYDTLKRQKNNFENAVNAVLEGRELPRGLSTEQLAYAKQVAGAVKYRQSQYVKVAMDVNGKVLNSAIKVKVPEFDSVKEGLFNNTSTERKVLENITAQ